MLTIQVTKLIERIHKILPISWIVPCVMAFWETEFNGLIHCKGWSILHSNPMDQSTTHRLWNGIRIIPSSVITEMPSTSLRIQFSTPRPSMLKLSHHFMPLICRCCYLDQAPSWRSILFSSKGNGNDWPLYMNWEGVIPLKIICGKENDIEGTSLWQPWQQQCNWS